MFLSNKKFFLALSILVGMIVGAGIFGLPYVVEKSGLIPSFFYFLILGLIIILVHLFFGEIVLRTKEKKRLPGFVQSYLGGKWKTFVVLSTFVGLTGALLAYIILSGNFLKILFSPWFSLDSFYFSLIFWAILVYFIFRGIKIIAPAEIFTNFIFFLIVFIVFFFALPKVNFQNFTLFNLPEVFLPYGVILFSLVGLPAIPEAVEVLKSAEDKKILKKVILTSFLIIILLYFLFIFVVIGTCGKATSSDTFQGLTPFLGTKIIFFGALAAVITLADSFLVVGLYLKNVLIYDYKFPKFSASLFVSGLPLILFLAGFRGFIETIGIVGTIVGTIESVLIILIFKNIKKLGNRKPEYSLKIPSFLLYFLILVFVFGLFLQIFYFLK